MSKIHPVIREIATEDRAHDPWGATITTLGALCDVVTAYGDGDKIPVSVGYSPGIGLRFDGEDVEERLESLRYNPASGENYPQWEIVCALFPNMESTHWVENYDPDMSMDDVHYAIGVLDRSADLLKLLGRDY